LYLGPKMPISHGPAAARDAEAEVNTGEMLALQFDENGLTVRNTSKPRRDGEALVRVLLAGVCNTDLEIVRGYAGFHGTLGHEFVGVVEDSPERSQIGRRVVGEINAGCGSCELCRSGDSRHCATRTVLGIHGREGAFAEYLTLPPANLVPVPDGISDEEAVFTEPLAAACEILDQVSVGEKNSVAVIGDGKLAQLIARVVSTTGCSLVVIGKHESKLGLLRDIGIETAKPGSFRPTGRFDVTIEASGKPEGFLTALDLTKPRGTIVLKSTFNSPVQVDTWRIVVDEITLVGSRCGRFQPALDLLSSKRVDVLPLITSRFPLADGVAAIEAASRPGALKVLLAPAP
jgi:threonine dehydrogenase-like Zn-dependent dehydrogenase